MANPEDQYSYREELTELYTIAILATNVCKYHKINSGSITVGCDEFGVLKKALDHYTIFSCRSNQLISSRKLEIYLWRDQSPGTGKMSRILVYWEDMGKDREDPKIQNKKKWTSKSSSLFPPPRYTVCG